MTLEITTARPESALLDLPWSTPLEDWPEEYLAALPRGISRHVVRFVRLVRPRLPSRRSRPTSRTASTRCCGSCAGSTCPASSRSASSPAATTPDGEPLDAVPDHPAPAVLAALPGAVQPVPAPRHGRPGSSTRWRCCWSGCTSRLLLGRRVPVQHAVPPRRRRLRRLPRRRRDRRAAPSSPTASATTTSTSPASTSSAS